MAKKLPPQFVKKAVPVAKNSKAAKGKLTPVQAAKIKHKADAVLGKHDCSYHNA